MKLGLTVIQNRNSFLMSLQSTSRHERIQRTKSGSPGMSMPVCRLLVLACMSVNHWQSPRKNLFCDYRMTHYRSSGKKTEHHFREMNLLNITKVQRYDLYWITASQRGNSESESWGLIYKLDSRIRDKTPFCCYESIICVLKLFEKYFFKTATNTVLEDWCDNTYHAREQPVLNQLNTRQSELFTDFWRKVLYSNPSHF